MKQFNELGISEPILKALEELRFKAPTQIQEKAIPLALQGKDLLAGSATGSGKTLAFGASIIQNSEKHKGIQALILTPTRELAEQVSESLKKFSKHKSLKIVPVYGGVSIQPQIKALPEAEIVVGTPGRILDHIERKTIRLSEIKTLILDEADRMLDMGFINDIDKIVSNCPKKRQTLLFSATLSQDISHMSKKYMNNPQEIFAESNVDPTKLKQIYYDCPDNLKFSLLVHLIKNEESGIIMVFCNTRRNTDFVAKHLRSQKIDAVAIHGGLSQDKRNRTLANFHASDVHVLVCTDVAARGLDISDVSHVYNYDIPRDAKEYMHRIGRTARAGKHGQAINIITSRDYENFSNVLKINELKIERKETPKIEKVMIKWDTPKRNFKHKGKPRHNQRNNNRSSNNRRRR